MKKQQKSKHGAVVKVAAPQPEQPKAVEPMELLTKAITPVPEPKAVGPTKAPEPKVEPTKPAEEPTKANPFKGHKWTPAENDNLVKLLHAERDHGLSHGKACTVVAEKLGMRPGQIMCAYDVALRKLAWAGKKV